MGNYKSSTKSIYSLILVLAWILFSNAMGQQSWRTCVIVFDGDTIVLDGNEIVRLIGIDTPETMDPRKAVQYYVR